MSLVDAGIQAQQFKLQDEVNSSQVAPVQNTWYTLMNVTGKLKIVCAFVGFDGAADETLEIRVTIDGHVLNHSKNCTHDKYYFCSYPDMSFTNGAMDMAPDSGEMLSGATEGLDCCDFKFELRKTTAAGAGTFFWRIIYLKK